MSLTNISTLGRKSQRASKCCWEHLHLEGNDCEMARAENRNNVNEKVVEKESCMYPVSAGNTEQKGY